jgi:hypothetical protein
MTEAIVYIDRSGIRPGGVEEVKSGSARLVEFIRAHEPQLISYAFYVDEVASSMMVVAVHPDSASLDLHLRIGGPEFRKLGHLIDLRSIEVFGEPSESVLSQLHEKAKMLGENAHVIVHRRHAGFARVSATPPLRPPEP